jgi:hypothetical protein
MKNSIQAILPLLAIVCMFSNCRATKRGVRGTWTTSFETISFKKDGTFSCRYSYGDEHREAAGTWYISKGTVYLNFKDPQGYLFGGCHSAQVYNNLIFGMRMIRGRDCIVPRPAKPIFYRKMVSVTFERQ